MTRSPTGIIPAEYDEAKHLVAVIEFLRNCPMDYLDKKELLFGWARNIGVKLANRHYLALIK